MPFVSILRTVGSENLRLLVSADRFTSSQVLTPEGTFVDGPDLVVFQREVPDPALLLTRLHTLLASSRVGESEDQFSCPVPLAIRAIETAVTDLWPTPRLRCQDCQRDFIIPYADRRRMYLACPNCHNPLLNPSWDSA